MNFLRIMPALFIAVSISTSAVASDYNFDWGSKNDMQGAWLMCSSTGFSQGDCPKVLRKCWQPPLIKCRRGKCKTLCTSTPSFNTSSSDIQKDLAAAGGKGVIPNYDRADPTVHEALENQSVTGNSFQEAAPICDQVTGECAFKEYKTQ